MQTRHPAFPSSASSSSPFSKVPAAIPSHIESLLEKPISWFKEDSNRVSGAEKKTFVGFVLDKSGSMEPYREVTIEGFNMALDEFKKDPATSFTLAQFSSDVEFTEKGVSISHARKLSKETFNPSGYTSLYDGIGFTISEMLKLPMSGDASSAFFITILTDGGENSSSTFTATTLASIIERLSATGRWTFALAGPAKDVKDLTELLKLDKSNVIGYTPDSMASRLQISKALAESASSYVTCRSMGATVVGSLYSHIEGDL